MFSLTEEKALLFHRALMGLIREHPNLIDRSLAELEKCRQQNPGQMSVWDRWQALLDMPIDDMAVHVLADTPDGGLMRAHSPLGKILLTAERNAVWQRIGLMQFVNYFLDAVDSLGLSLEEQAALTGQDQSELTGWRKTAPTMMASAVLDRLKIVVSLHKAISQIEPKQNIQQRWLRTESETLGAAPISLLLGGEADRVLENLSGAVRLTLTREDLPRMGG
ncbi:MAG: hypothetical protein HN377_09470 [Alphaproteobacteria bacterium]|jgi:hypothetical protein|nr:hypothetical protein [Alphaproteobacteria bacterium]MBT7942211.1 hypothetical protein [Alphaproteobacteria bacterium]